MAASSACCIAVAAGRKQRRTEFLIAREEMRQEEVLLSVLAASALTAEDFPSLGGAPAADGGGSHSRQRCPLLGAEGREPKYCRKLRPE